MQCVHSREGKGRARQAGVALPAEVNLRAQYGSTACLHHRDPGWAGAIWQPCRKPRGP